MGVTRQSILTMISKTVLTLLALCLILVASMPSNTKKKQFSQMQARTDIMVKPKNHGFETKQGDCPDGWIDASEVGLGCLWADVEEPNLSEPDSMSACERAGGELVEILNMDQMTFLQGYLIQVEQQSLAWLEGYVFWWIGLNDLEKEGDFVWPISGAVANYTNWKDGFIVDFDEPAPDPNHERNCVEMLSAENNGLAWMTYLCEDIDSIYHVCQII